MIRHKSIRFAALAVLALTLPAWSADPPPIPSRDQQQLFAPPPANSAGQVLQTVKPVNFFIRDPATNTARVAPVSHEAQNVTNPHFILAQVDEDPAFELLDTLPEVTDDFPLDADSTDDVGQNAQTMTPEVVMDAPAVTGGRPAGKTIRRRKDGTYDRQPWTFTEMLKRPEDYHREACEAEFCRHVWQCAGGRNLTPFQRWQRNARRGYESRAGAGPSIGSNLLSRIFVEPLLGYGFVGGTFGAWQTCEVTSDVCAEGCLYDGSCTP